MNLDPGQEFGGYRILSYLGSGGMGTVYRARQIRLGRDVALKVLTSMGDSDGEATRRFRREMDLQTRLSHPNLVTVYDAGTEAGRQYIAMELLEGGTFEDHIRDSGPLPVSEVVVAVTQVTAGVGCLHEAGVIHRDIKPLNVLAAQPGSWKLTDFGLARAEHHTAMTRASQVLGTPRYFAPEIVRGEPAGPASDVFSLGVLAYRALTAEYPFPGEGYAEYLRALLSLEPVPPGQRRPGLPAPLATLILAMLSKGVGRTIDGSCARGPGSCCSWLEENKKSRSEEHAVGAQEEELEVVRVVDGRRGGSRGGFGSIRGRPKDGLVQISGR